MRPALSTVAPLDIALRRARTAVGRNALWTLVATSATVGLSTLDTVAVNVALPTLERDLHAPVTEGAWLVSSFFLAVLAFVAVAGRVADQFGRRRTLMFGTAIFSGASLLCAIAPDAGWLIAGRAVQGVGAAFMVAPARAVIVNAFPRAYWGRALGATTALASATVFGGPILAGAVIDAASWRWVFLINLPLAALALWLLQSALPHATHARLEADLGAHASGAQFSRGHEGLGARVVRQGSATGFRSVVLLRLLVVVVTTLVTLVVWLR
jgi:MFS family permease